MFGLWNVGKLVKNVDLCSHFEGIQFHEELNKPENI